MRTLTSRRLLAGTYCSVLMLGAGQCVAQTFPPTNAWLPLTQQGGVLGDSFDGVPPLSIASLDIVGDKANPGGYVTSDANALYFRLNVASNPYSASKNRFASYVWMCLLDIDSDPTTYELMVALNGSVTPNTVDLLQNTTTSKADSIGETADATLVSHLTASGGVPVNAQVPPVPSTSTFGPNPNYFVDFAADWTDLVAAAPTALAKNVPFRVVCGTGDWAPPSTTPNSLSGEDVLDNGQGLVSFSAAASDAVWCNDTGCAYYDPIFKDGFEGP